MRALQREEIDPLKDSIATVRRKARLATALEAMEKAQAQLDKAKKPQAQRQALEALRRAKLQALASAKRKKRSASKRGGVLRLLG